MLTAVGVSIAWIVGFLFDPTPFGDDAIYYIGTVKSLASNSPALAWDPHVFAGYVPTIGLSWLTYFVPFVLVRLGIDAVAAFHLAFVCIFLLLGLSVYYFARSCGADRIVSFSLSILAWSTNAYWNNAIWGGAYNRAFSIPFMFLSLGMTYRYVSRLNDGKARSRDYWSCLALWTLTYLGDVFIAIAGTAVGLMFLLLSAGRNNIVSGIRRLSVILLPAVGLTSWQIRPILLQSFIVGPYRSQYTGQNDFAALFVPDSTWTATLNFVYVPLIVTLAVICLAARVQMSSVDQALLISLSTVGSYWFVMGWVPSLWPFLPRLMASNSSIENLAWIFLMMLPLLFAVLRKHAVNTVGSPLRVSLGRPFTIDSRRLLVRLRVLALLFIFVDALVVIPAIKPVNWGPLNDQLNAEISRNLGAPTSDYRISLQNRPLTRTLLFYQPDHFDTGGRVANLDPNPFFSSWYLTDVFYKNDLGSINQNYFEDNPTIDVSPLLESRDNFAGSEYWLDWYGASALVFYPYSYLHHTIGNYSARSQLFSVSEIPIREPAPEVFIKPANPSTISVTTNASVIGFYSRSAISQSEYHSLISLLADLGLSSRYVIPLYLYSISDAQVAHIDLLVTDTYTYSRYSSELQPVFQASNVLVVSSEDGQLGLEPIFNQHGARLLIDVPLSFSQLVQSREAGAYYFVKSASILGIESFSPSSSTSYGPYTMVLDPTSWKPAFKSENANGSLSVNSKVLALNVSSSDTTKGSEFNIESSLPNLVPLSKDLTVGFSVQTTENITLGTIISSPRACCPNYVALDRNVSKGDPVRLQIPFSDFHKWGDSSSMFGIGANLTFAVNLPLGESNTIVQFSNVTVTSPTYTIFSLPKPVSLSNEGVLVFDTAGASGIGLLNGSNASTAVLNLDGYLAKSAITPASFSGGKTGDQYDKIIAVGGNVQITPVVSLFSPALWRPVHQEWTNNENMIISTIPEGFRGLVWKGTYNQHWRFESESSGVTIVLPYYYAGPGMIYVPISNTTSGIKASFVSTDIESIAAYSILVVTMIALALLRNRLPTFGRFRRLPRMSEHC